MYILQIWYHSYIPSDDFELNSKQKEYGVTNQQTRDQVKSTIYLFRVDLVNYEYC